MHENIHRIKEKINREGVQPNTLFKFVDLQEKGYIDAEDIRVLLQEHNVFCEAKNMKCLMKLFRKKIDERIKAKEFTSFVDL